MFGGGESISIISSWKQTHNEPSGRGSRQWVTHHSIWEVNLIDECYDWHYPTNHILATLSLSENNPDSLLGDIKLPDIVAEFLK